MSNNPNWHKIGEVCDIAINFKLYKYTASSNTYADLPTGTSGNLITISTDSSRSNPITLAGNGIFTTANDYLQFSIQSGTGSDVALRVRYHITG